MVIEMENYLQHQAGFGMNVILIMSLVLGGKKD